MFHGVCRLRGGLPSVYGMLRHLCTVPETSVTVDKSMLSKLRKKTGYPMINCKKALVQFDNDLKQAESWMREQAQKEGWSKAGKLQGRAMSQGLVGLIHDDNATTILELNCETDFVAKNEKFQDLLYTITEACHKNFSATDSAMVKVDQSELNAVQDGSVTLGDHVAMTVGNLGENIAIRRAVHIPHDTDTVTRSYIHAAGPKVFKDRVSMGKFAAVVKVEVPDPGMVAEQLCQQVVGLSPTSLGPWHKPVLDKKEMKKQKKKKEMEDKDKEGENVVKKIVPEIGSELYEQEFLMDSSKTVRQFIQDNSPKVTEFVRIECGEDLGEDD